MDLPLHVEVAMKPAFLFSDQAVKVCWNPLKGWILLTLNPEPLNP